MARALPERTVTWVSFGLMAAIVLGIWIPWMINPLTLDETGSQWVISGGLAKIIHRSIVFPQSILYCFLLWGESIIAGTSEFALRFPSLLASVGTLIFLSGLGARAIGNRDRFLLPLFWLFFLSPSILSVQARPYALAMCAGAWALYAMSRFLSDGTATQLCQFALAVSLSTWFSFLFLLPQAGYAVFLLLLTFWFRKVPVKQCLGVLVLWALLFLPLIPQIREVAADSALHTIPNAIHDRQDLFLAFLPPVVVLGLMIALVTTLVRGESSPETRLQTRMLLLAVLVAIMSVVPLYLVTQFTPAKLWAARYMSLAFAPLALLYAAILGRYSGAWGRLGAIIVPALLLFMPSLTTRVTAQAELAESFPKIVSALEVARHDAGGHLYLLSSFAEGWRLRFPVGDADKEWLLAPYRYYKLAEPYGILPHSIGQVNLPARGSLIAGLQDEGNFVVAGSNFPDWLGTAVESTHSVRFVTRGDSYFIAVFTRR